MLNVTAPGVLTDDNDGDGNPLTAVVVSASSNGTLTLNTDGSFNYIPNANFHGSDTFTYMANDGLVNSTLATVTITVNPINDAPTATDDSYMNEVDTVLTIDAPGVLVNDADVDGNLLAAVVVSGPSSGALNFNSNGSFDYTPTLGFFGIDNFTYQANDGLVNSNQVTVTILVHPPNDAPVAADDMYAIDEDAILSIPADGVLANDNDGDSDPLTAVKVSEPNNGTLTLNTDGSFAYTPNADFHGNDMFTYVANDGLEDSTVATVTITVNSINDAPTATDDSYTTDKDRTLTIAAPGVLVNDADVDDDPLTTVEVSGPSNGSLILNSDGSFDYTPTSGFSGVDSFVYKTNDGLEDSNQATVTITVIVANLLGHWTFDDDDGDSQADDISGNLNHGTLVNGPVFEPGQLGQALRFDGNNDYVDLATLDVGGSGLTIAGWFNADSFLAGNQDNRLVSKATSISEQDHYWMLSTFNNAGNTRLRFRLKTDGTTATLIAGSGNISPGQWYHVAAVYDGSNMRVYLDGVDVGSLPKTGVINSDNTVSAWIGGNPPGATSRPFDGLMDDVRIYDQALTLTEIQQLVSD